jgi:hypothetical protein
MIEAACETAGDASGPLGAAAKLGIPRYSESKISRSRSDWGRFKRLLLPRTTAYYCSLRKKARCANFAKWRNSAILEIAKKS